jgi:hypothetical protein
MSQRPATRPPKNSLVGRNRWPMIVAALIVVLLGGL